MTKQFYDFCVSIFFLLVCCLSFFIPNHASAHTGPQYRPPESADPVVEAILKGPNCGRAFIRLGANRFHAVNGTKISSEWTVEEIRRESVLFSRKSNRTFVEIKPLIHLKPSYHRGWSFIGGEITLWDALEILAAGFGHHVVMHSQCSGTVTPYVHGTTLEGILAKILPANYKFAFIGPVLAVLPREAAGESWLNILEKLKKRDSEVLALRFQGLKKAGTLLSRGNDIQFVLHQIALGGGTRLQFPRNLHFPVYASFNAVPFNHILGKIVYLNQCFIIDRTDRLEILPWPRQNPTAAADESDFITAEPFIEQAIYGPIPPSPFFKATMNRFWAPLEPPPSSTPLPRHTGQDSE